MPMIATIRSGSLVTPNEDYFKAAGDQRVFTRSGVYTILGIDERSRARLLDDQGKERLVHINYLKCL